jgi:hypothetical protein
MVQFSPQFGSGPQIEVAHFGGGARYVDGICVGKVELAEDIGHVTFVEDEGGRIEIWLAGVEGRARVEEAVDQEPFEGVSRMVEAILGMGSEMIGAGPGVDMQCGEMHALDDTRTTVLPTLTDGRLDDVRDGRGDGRVLENSDTEVVVTVLDRTGTPWGEAPSGEDTATSVASSADEFFGCRDVSISHVLSMPGNAFLV